MPAQIFTESVPAQSMLVDVPTMALDLLAPVARLATAGFLLVLPTMHAGSTDDGGDEEEASR